MPRQARSKQLVDDVLEAALRVLRRDGAGRFTTVRVAEEAGVSVGSLYQYFPNKQSLLFRLQADEWKETGDVLAEILADARRAPLERLRSATVAFFRSERDEALLREALEASIREGAEGEPREIIAHAPETRAHRTSHAATILAFMQQALPSATAETRAFAAEFVATSLSSLAERITSRPVSRTELDRWAHATSDAHAAYLERLEAAAREAR